MPGLPDISLITSWHGGVPKDGATAAPPAGLVGALQAGVGLIDLYFLNHLEIPWYRTQCRREPDRWPDHSDVCPLCFAAALEPSDIHRIGDALVNLTVNHYAGRLIGPRPRFTALATFWPFVNSDSPEARSQSVRAIQNSLLLARYLGCRHVEIVGGSAFSDSDGTEAKSINDRDAASLKARERRHQQLCESLRNVYRDERGMALFGIGEGPDQGSGPYLCLEIEPGQAFLINTVDSFLAVRETLSAYPNVQSRVLLNVDLAHMFLADADQPGLKHAGQRQLNAITEPVKDWVGHFHASDHARTHASDLCPGSYHFLVPDYAPWLKLASDLVGRPRFSNTVAIEMEACAEIHEIMRSLDRTRNWAQSVVSDETCVTSAGAVGAILAVDIVNSTECLAVGGTDFTAGALRLDLAVSSISRAIQSLRGSVYSFTGDGVVAIFDQRHYQSVEECARKALTAADLLYATMKEALQKVGQWKAEEEKHLALRIALHWGEAAIPTTGPLAQQLLGADVIIGCRLMNASDPPRRRNGGNATHRVNQSVSEPFFVRAHLDADVWSQLTDEELEGRFKGIHFQTFRNRVDKVHVRKSLPFRSPRRAKL